MSHVPIPPMLRKRKRFGGLPIPYVGARDRRTGRPLFGFNDLRRVARAAERGLCSQCGEPLVGSFAFIGGESECSQRLFKEAPMHPACARYVLSVCPYFTRGQHGQARPPKGEGVVLLRFGDEKLPPLERWAIFQTRSFAPISTADGQLVFRAGPPVAAPVCFERGRALDPPEAQR